jgi:hypothetical protein
MTHHFKEEIKAVNIMVPKWKEDYPSFRWDDWDRILNRTIKNTLSVAKRDKNGLNYIFDDVLYGFIRIQQVIKDTKTQTKYFRMLGQSFSKQIERDRFIFNGKPVSIDSDGGYYTSIRDNGFLYFCEKYGLKNL